MGRFNKEKFSGIGAGLLSEVSKDIKDADAVDVDENMVIIYKNISELVPNKKNKYSMQSILTLAENIKTVGRIQQPIVYLEPALPDGRNKIIAGHRRYEAYKILNAEDSNWGEKIPCTPITINSVKLPISDESKERYLILTTNIDNREKNDSDLMNEYLEQKAIYQEAKANGYKLTDKMRNMIAKDIHLSPAQVGKMEYIDKHAATDVKAALQQDTITLSAAHQVAHLQEDEQIKIIDDISSNLSTIESIVPKEKNDTQLAPTDPLGDKKLMQREAQKVIKPKIIDQLTDESYFVDKNELLKLSVKLEPLKRKVEDSGIELEKKEYAKYKSAIMTIEKEIQKVEKLFRK